MKNLLPSTACRAVAGEAGDGLDIPEALRRTAPVAAPATETATPATPAPAKPKREKKAKAAKPAKTKEAKAPRSIVPAKFKAKYADHDGSNGDRIAAAFRSYTTTTNADGRECMDEDKLNEVAKANGIEVKNYAKMNNGQKRMNVGNRLRGILKSGQTVTIGSMKFADAKKALVVQPVKAKPAKASKGEAAQHAAA